jgi:hypothetical protein
MPTPSHSTVRPDPNPITPLTMHALADTILTPTKAGRRARTLSCPRDCFVAVSSLIPCRDIPYGGYQLDLYRNSPNA